MRARSEAGAFPCPFCQSEAVLLIGGSRHHLYYSCAACAEIWTATHPPADPDLDDDEPRPTVH